MTADNIAIDSTNFSLDNDGSMSCSDATITGGNIRLIDDTTSSSSSSLSIRSSNGEHYTNIKPYWMIMAGSESNGSIHLFNDGDYKRISLSGGGDKTIENEIDVSADKMISSWRRGNNTNNPTALTTVEAEKIDTPRVIADVIEVRNSGKCMYGMNSHLYRCQWTGYQLDFYVDDSNIGTLSDARLKTEIEDIDEDFINAIKEIEMKQFKVANRNGLVSFGILAQDLIEIFEKYNKNPFDYEIVQKTQYKTDDDTIYYTINYEQFLVLKTKAQEVEIEELKTKDEEKNNLIEDLIRRVEKLEKGEK